MPSSTSPARRPTVNLVNMPIENKRRAEGIRHAAASVRREGRIEVDRPLELLEAHGDPVIAVTDPPHHALLRGARVADSAVLAAVSDSDHEQQPATSKTTSHVLLMSQDATNATRRRPAHVIYA